MDNQLNPDLFFIADKLRGIPLVSAGLKRENQSVPTIHSPKSKLTDLPEEQSLTSRSRNRHSNSNTHLAVATQSTTRKPVFTSTSTNPLTYTPKSKILHKQSWLSTTTTTTTPKPLKTTTKRPSKIKPINLTPKPINSVKLAKLLRSASSSTTPTTIPLNTTPYPPTSKNENIRSAEVTFPEDPASTSTKRWSSSQLSSLPDLQRRNLQTVLSSNRFTNKLGDNNRVGENWSLFKRSDGRFSPFEALVLVSNILIVSVILVVILSNWFKSIKKKREGKQKNIDLEASKIEENRQVDIRNAKLLVKQPAKETKSDLNLTPSMPSPASGRLSGLSEIVSVETSIERHSNLNVVPGSLMSTQEESSSGIGKLLESKKVGNARKIVSSELISSSTSVVNKAMAIVQPSENTSEDNLADSLEKKKNSSTNQVNVVKADIHPIGGIISDLSGSAINSTPDTVAVAKMINDAKKEQVSDVKNEKERMDLLEDAFKRSAPDLSMNNSDIMLKNSVEEKGISKSKPKEILRGSLESIDLPGPLVESIKQSDPAATGSSQVDPSPSPNLLLGEISTVAEQKEIINIDENEAKKKEKLPEKVEKKRLKGATEGDEKQLVNTTNNENKNVSIIETTRASPKQTKVPEKQPEKDVIVEGADSNKSNSKKQQRVDGPVECEANVKNHQTVVNKLDKRKTNLEIVDLRDESVIGRMRNSKDAALILDEGENEGKEGSSGWISMDGVALVQGGPSGTGTNSSIPPLISAASSSQMQQPVMSPSEIIESRFHVDYKNGRHKDSVDSKSDEKALHIIEDEIEEANKMRNRKYFVYIVQDGHFTAKKECIARIELPPKRRVTLAEMRQLIANSQDISLTSLRRNRFKFVTETYRLLNENEDAALLQQVYPTQGVFLKLNIPEQEGIIGGYSANKAARARISSLAGGPSNLGATTISSRRRATRKALPTGSGSQQLPAIEVDYASSLSQQQQRESAVAQYGRTRAASVGRPRKTTQAGGTKRSPPKRAKSSLQEGVTRRSGEQTEKLPAIGRSQVSKLSATRPSQRQQTSPIGAQMLSGAKRLLRNTFSSQS